MKTLHLVTIVILCSAVLSSSIVFVTMSQRAYATDCGIKETSLTIPQFYRLSDAVFVGTISSIQSYANHQWMVKFDTEKIWKGTSSPKIAIITGNIQACGYSLVQGEKYLIFANGSPLDYISWFSRPYADAQADIAIFDDPQFQAQEKYKEELNKKLEAAKDAISNLMGSRWGDIPFNMVGVDVINSTLDVGIDSTKATLSEAEYLKKIKEIVGDIPIKITFGQIVADVGDSSNNIPRKDLPSPLQSPLKQFKSGITANHIICKKDLYVILKAENSFPACVSIETGKKLALRGWATTFGTTISTDYWSTCNKPVPQSDSGTIVLYMPTNSIGKICLSYSNFNNEPEPVTPPGISDPNNSYQKPNDVAIWTYTPISTISNVNGTTVAYFIKTGNQTGFYGLSLPSCGMIPFAVGYNNDSRITSSDFPFLGVSVSCPPGMLYPQFDGIEGIGVKYIP